LDISPGIRLTVALDSSTIQGENRMSIAKISEISAASKKSFEDAIQQGIKRFAKTVKNVEGAWIKEQKVVVAQGVITEYRVVMNVTFVLDDKKSK
jgi:flavin-binding protein dodecin